VRYKQLGRTGVRVSVVSLGTATFGVAPLETDADRLIGRAIDLGINSIDMANSYGNQARFDRPGAPPWSERASAEEIVGRALGARRRDLILCSKVMEPVGEGVNDRGLSRRHIFHQLELSLNRLRTDHLDVYYAHHPDPSTPIEETVRAFDDLVRRERSATTPFRPIRRGEVVDTLWKADALGAHPPICLQVPYNLTRREVELDIVSCLPVELAVDDCLQPAGRRTVLRGTSARQREFVGHRRWGGTGFGDREIALAVQLEQIASTARTPTGVSGARLAHLTPGCRDRDRRRRISRGTGGECSGGQSSPCGRVAWCRRRTRETCSRLSLRHR